MTEALLLVVSAHFLAVASPGPSNMAIMATAMGLGRRPALALAHGVTAGSLTWGCLAAAGVSALVAAYAGALYAIKIAGGLYLLFLGYRAARSALQAEGKVGTSVPLESSTRTFVRGYLMHLTNPKAILSWTAIIALGLPNAAPSNFIPKILGGCLLISLVCNSAYALIFSTAPMIAAYRRARRAIETALAGFFAFAGLRLLVAN